MSECCERHKVREAEEYRLLINRLNRIEGQVRGIKNMVENSQKVFSHIFFIHNNIVIEM